MKEVECFKCNRLIIKTEKQIKKNKKHFCSRNCSSTYNSKEKANNFKKSLDDNGGKVCSKCHILKPVNEFYIRNTKHSFKLGLCKKCKNQNDSDKRKQFKQSCVEYKGGKCFICSYNKFPGALDFHHLDPLKKDFAIGTYRAQIFTIKIKNELDKCILLCANCHREFHGGFIKLPEINNV